MEGIVSGLQVKQKGRVRYELLTDDGEIHVLETTAYYMPDLRCRLFSPQAHFQELFQSGQDPNERSGITIKRNRGTINWANRMSTTLDFCENTFLPRLRVYKNALDSAKDLALKGCVTDEVNQNLTQIQKVALRLHF
jgi:hypothetical protein